MKNINQSQVAGGNISFSQNKVKNNNEAINISIKKIRTESAIISFIVGFAASILASFVFEYLSK